MAKENQPRKPQPAAATGRTPQGDRGSEQFHAVHRFARISARKARLVMDTIRGDAVEAALIKLRFCQRRASPMIRKVVQSAMSNATQKAGLDASELVIWRAFVDEGPTIKRFRPRSMGRAFPRLRRTCHLSVILKPALMKKAPRRETRQTSSHPPPEGGHPMASGGGEDQR
jgi:large subunit ribosomal protein L22